MSNRRREIPVEDRERIANIWNEASVEAVQRHAPPHVIHVLREEYLRERRRLGLPTV